MAIDIKPILKAGVVAQAGALAIKNVKLLKKKKIKSGDLIKVGFGNIVGVTLIKSQNEIIDTL